MGESSFHKQKIELDRISTASTTFPPASDTSREKPPPPQNRSKTFIGNADPCCATASSNPDTSPCRKTGLFNQDQGRASTFCSDRAWPDGLPLHLVDVASLCCSQANGKCSKTRDSRDLRPLRPVQDRLDDLGREQGQAQDAGHV